MCRWLAYSGPSLALDTLLFKPTNSLIRQSLSASRGAVPTNGDGFGVGWYGELPHPGVFRDTLPAWNDANLRSLTEQIRSSLFFAHVRASTGTSTSRENCHPFRCKGFLFMHNGGIGGFARVRRDVEQLIAAEWYAHRLGTTDSEAFFLLALTNGLERDPAGALAKTVGQVLDIMARAQVEEPFRMTAAVTRGAEIVALRFSSDRQSPSLFHATGGAVEVEAGAVRFAPGRGSVLVLSEPLDEDDVSWQEVPEAHVLTVKGGEAWMAPF